MEIVANRCSPPAILLREGSKVRKRTLASLSSWPRARIDALCKLLRNGPLVTPDQVFTIPSSLPHGHVELVLEAFRRLRLPALLDRRRSRQWHSCTLARRHLGEDTQVLFDVSSSYYEGRTCPLMQFGYSRNCKRGRPIVVNGVLADHRSRPVAVQAYPGNTADPSTLPDRIETLRDRFGLQQLVLVDDRGMLTDTQVETLPQSPGLGWISALRHDEARNLAAQEIVQMSLFDARGLAEIRLPL